MMLLPKPTSRAQDKRDRAREKLRLWQQVRRFVLQRDGGRCRACGSRQDVDVHHIKFRSMGGTHTTSNCCALCRICHAELHAYRLAISGDANGTLKMTRER